MKEHRKTYVPYLKEWPFGLNILKILLKNGLSMLKNDLFNIVR